MVVSGDNIFLKLTDLRGDHIVLIWGEVREREKEEERERERERERNACLYY